MPDTTARSAPFILRARDAAAHAVLFLARPPWVLEMFLWLFFIAAAAGVRFYLVRLVPVYMWSNDAGSYANPVFRWLETGTMVFDGRRGPVYTLFIAAITRLTGSMSAVMCVQHALGAIGIISTAAAARVFWGRAAAVPLLLCGLGYATYGLPIALEHLIRNETLLFFFSSLAFSFWLLALKWDAAPWLFLASLSAGLLTLTKDVFLTFPLALVCGALFFSAHPWRTRIVRSVLIVLGFLLPILAYKAHRATAAKIEAAQPQSGILLYGRTAQWTKIDGGIEPEIKVAIRANVESYRQLPKLDNNIIIKRTIVPQLKQILYAQGKTPSDVDRLCRRLAIEAIASHPAAFVRQMLNDIHKMHTKLGVENQSPSASNMRENSDLVASLDEVHAVMRQQETIETLRASADKNRFRAYYSLLRRAWLFQFYPALLTTLGIPLLVACLRGNARLLFLGVAAVWFFNVVLLSTVGRPLERYLIPVVPLMFLTMSGVAVLAWTTLVNKLEQKS